MLGLIITKPKQVEIQENREMEHLCYTDEADNHLSGVEFMWMWRDYWDKVD